ncbi:RNA polymerase sigma factor [Sphingomonas sanguinis]|uniref:RNA polymerase sigma factor 70 region 4 type 2 domain-containing protein n=1 Tax=Sphingomonas sanguinis TaxID=33051 RepID=A0A147JB58_9SPHN|nr:sigma-70 family RNA polymerase sigma factor [Sphingomonas sanguinis]KTT71768.1 hypothetical protein NS319_05500 [Sphingomonas sanguinis]KTW15253.1 hypothetical protein NS258_05530 [Sphingomonas sanguinis]
MPCRRERNAWLAAHVLPYEAWIRRAIARQVASGGIEVDDLIQESYALLARLPSVEGIAVPHRYALQVARSVLLQHVRRARIVAIDAVADLDTLDALTDEPTPEEHMLGRHELARVAAAIEAMPEAVRRAFWLRRVEGLPQREVAARLGLPESTVEKQISRGIKMLASRFSRGGSAVSRASTSDIPATESRPTDDLARDRGRY